MQRAIDLSLSVLASVVSFLLSWPYWRTFSYWPESRTAWIIYFVLGFVLAVFVFYVFFRALRTIFNHEGHGDHGHHHHTNHDHHHHAHSDAQAQHRRQLAVTDDEDAQVLT